MHRSLIPILLANLAAGAPFTDVTSPAGIAFSHWNARSEQKYLVETMGSGCAFLDFDQDGFLDIFFVNGGETPARKLASRAHNALYRSNGDGTFTNVTEKAGVGDNPGFGMGAIAGDYDNDGFPDLYVSGFEASVLYHNNGDGTFSDVTTATGVGNANRWATSGAWLDYDSDGRLDLIVANYLDYDYERNQYCGEKKPGFRMYCHPNNYDGVHPTLFRNQGDGTFRDVTREAGLTAQKAKGLGVIAADFDNDGRTDLFIANDSIRNLLYRNRGDGVFEDVTFASGTGYSEDGMAEAGMGTDAGDYNRDGLLEIFVTHLDFELNRLYENRGGMEFADMTNVSGLGRTAVLNSGWGTRFFDYDLDGWQDLLIVNGHVLDNVSLYRPAVDYAERKVLYRNQEGKFVDVSGSSGSYFDKASVGRGLAIGDFDNDGDVDFLVSNNGGAGELVRNDLNTPNHWLTLSLEGTTSNRDGAGARVRIVAGGAAQYQQRTGGTSYLSSSDKRITFGLDAASVVDSIEVLWPSGRKDRLENVQADRIVTVKEGAGEVRHSYPRFP